MTIPVIIMIVIGIIMCLASFFISEKIFDKEEKLHNLMSVEDDYEFSDRELRIIRRKIEDVIANQAKDILYETNESLSGMANEKTMALGDYAVAVCEQIEKNHKEVMFLYSMLDDKQKDIMKTVRIVDDANKEVKEVLDKLKQIKVERVDNMPSANRKSAIEQTEPVESADHTCTDTDDLSALEESDIPEFDIDSETEDYDVMKNTADEDFNDMEDVFAELDQTGMEFDEILEEEFVADANSNDIILQMHHNGNSILDIAKELGLGVGEVKLVIDLYHGN